MATLSRTAVKCARLCNGASFSTEANTSVLSNGIKVVSCGSGATTSVGVSVNAGSRNETASTAGAALLLKHMAFKNTAKRSDLKIARDVEAAGLTVDVVSGREKILYTATGLPSAFETGMEALGETIVSPKLQNWEVSETVGESVKYELDQVAKDPQLLLLEAIHESAFGRDAPMGRTFFVHPKLNGSALQSYMSSLYTPANMTIYGAGVSHDALVAAAEKSFGGVQGTSQSPAPAKFVGGGAAVHAKSAFTHMALTFASQDAATSAVLKELLSRHLAASGVVANAFSINYSDAGLVGVFGAAAPDAAGALSEQLVGAMKSLASSDDASVNAAKLAVKTQLAFAHEHPADAVQSMAAGSVNVDSVSSGAVKDLAGKILKSSPAFAVVGDSYSAPTAQQVFSLL